MARLLTNDPPDGFVPAAADELVIAAFDLIERGIIPTRSRLSDALEHYVDLRFSVMDGSGIRRLREAIEAK